MQSCFYWLNKYNISNVFNGKFVCNPLIGTEEEGVQHVVVALRSKRINKSNENSSIVN